MEFSGGAEARKKINELKLNRLKNSHHFRHFEYYVFCTS